MRSLTYPAINAHRAAIEKVLETNARPSKLIAPNPGHTGVSEKSGRFSLSPHTASRWPAHRSSPKVATLNRLARNEPASQHSSNWTAVHKPDVTTSHYPHLRDGECR